MRLRRVIIKNFRGYNGEHVIDLEKDLTALVGKNDAGKSTVLEALEIFFGDSKPELEDLNIHADDREMRFGCIFDELPDEVTVDTSAKTTLNDEYLVNEDGNLEVIKSYTCTEKTMPTKPEVIVGALHPTTKDYDDLLKLKLQDLKDRAKELGVGGVKDQRVNSLWRKAIWEHAPNLDIRKKDLKIDEFDAKVKAIYTNVESLFPHYYMFKVDRQTSDGDSEAKDPMQLAVKEAQKEFQTDISKLQEKIQKRVDEVAEKALEKLHEMDASLASKLNPTLKSAPKWTFDYKIEDDRGVLLNKRGSGTRRLVLLNFFRAEAEKKSQQGSGSIIYAIEEPETSQHPNNQQMVIKSLTDLAKDDKRQVLITTHSPQLLEDVTLESIRFVEFDNAAKNVILHQGESGLVKAADSLGILSNQKLGSCKAVVLVEGETDEIFLNHASEVLSADGKITSSLEDAKILVLPAGSCSNIPFWVQKLRLKSLGLPFIVFMDCDRTSATEPETLNEKRCKDIIAAGEKAIFTKKREIENYIDKSHSGVTYTDFDDAKKMIIAHKKYKKQSKVITELWPKMTAAQIIANSTYKDGTTTKVEVVDILNEILAIAPTS